MSIARHHAEWLSLVEPNGPFLSISVLQSVFPQGLDKTPSDRVQALRSAYAEWLADAATPVIHRAWVEYVLQNLLNLPAAAIASGQAIPPHLKCEMPEHGETIRPDLVIHNPGKPHEARLLLLIFPPGQGLEKVVAGKRWAASPAARASTLLRRSGVRLGLVTNGEQWLLINAPPNQSSGQALWEADLWQQERLTLDAFTSLLGRHRCFNVPDDETLAALLDKSANDQQEITDQLGYQVRKAVEILVQTLDRLDADQQRQLLCGVSAARIYEAALTVMMRLVFLLSAEQRGLLLLDDAIYQQHYAISTLAGQLRATANQQGEEVLERRFDAWCRLLATWRAVYGGIQHEDLRLPAYGGTLFDPDRFAFLEGRSEGSHWRNSQAQPLRIDNRTVLHLLEALQVLRVNVGGTVEQQRMSFRALDIEQIGHVYEGLLDHEARRASQTILGLRGSKNQEPEIALSQLQTAATKLIEFLHETSGRSVNALRNALAAPLDLLRNEQLNIACGNDATLLDQVRPFAGLLRDDDYGRPAIFPTGSLYVTAGTNRRNSGTHYTPRSLTEPIVQHTLEPLVYCGPAEGQPAAQWQLKSVKELLALKVCDMAMGSGAFLVQCCRYLAERVVEAWDRADQETRRGGERESVPRVTIWGERARGGVDELLIPNEVEERLALARRLVVERCLYGVDKNPLAVEMAKLSLWLITLAKGQPFTFVDHALKCGDSLVGVDLQQLRTWNLAGTGNSQPLLETLILDSDIQKMVALRQQIETQPAHDAQGQAEKGELLRRAEGYVHELKWAADMLVASYYNELPKAKQETLRRALLSHVRNHDDLEPAWLQYADLGGLQPFHWQLEFPEIFLANGQTGFDGFVGNPPFVGGKLISNYFGDTYRILLDELFPDSLPNADICAKFHIKAFQSICSPGVYGLIATDRISQGETKTGGLDMIVRKRGTIFRAANSQKWPGKADVRYSVVHVYNGHISPPYWLDDKPAQFIGTNLANSDVSEPVKILQSWGKSFVGCAIQGIGFTLEKQEAHLLLQNRHNAHVVHPFLIAKDLNCIPDFAPQRWIINFEDMDLDSASAYSECMEIIEQRVRPYRETVKRKAHQDKWWQFGDRRPGLVDACKNTDIVIACAMTTVEFKFVKLAPRWVFDQTLVIIVPMNRSCFPVLESSIHKLWAYEWGSDFGSVGAPRYNPSRCFQTFPFPELQHDSQDIVLFQIGEQYHEIRHQIMLTRHEGLTPIYNRLHKPQESAADITELRRLHVEMDNAVAAAYGWSNLDLGHGFHETAQGVRYTIHEAARREVLTRLLALNHERYTEEVTAGLHEKKKGKKGRQGGGETRGQEEGETGQLGLFS